MRFGGRWLLTGLLLGALGGYDAEARGRVAPVLQRAVDAFQRAPEQTLRAAKATPPGRVRFQAPDLVEVYVHETAAGAVAGDALLQLGARELIACASLSVIQCWLPIGALDTVAGLAGVRAVSPPSYGRTRSGSVVTQGDAILKAAEARARFSLAGAGVRVGVISDGVDHLSSSQARGDLPPTVIIGNPGSANFFENEGTAMLEIIYDLAPGATLGFSAGLTTATFINSINFHVNTFQADIIVDDVGFFDEPFLADGPVALAAQAAVAAGVVFVSAAGNESEEHYEADFTPAATLPGGIAGPVHDFGAGDIYLRLNAAFTVSALLQWNEPFDAPSSEYRLHAYSEPGAPAPAFSSENYNSYTGAAHPQAGANLEFSSGGRVYYLVVERVRGPAGRFEMFVLPKNHEYTMRENSIFGHPAAPGVWAVAAVGANTPGHNTVQPYSQVGPADIYVPAFASRPKPEFTAVDGVAVTGVGGFGSVFWGTSAAAPHAAAIAALALSASPSLTPAALRDVLQRTATDIETPGFDAYSGAGLLHAVRALSELVPAAKTTSWMIFR